MKIKRIDLFTFEKGQQYGVQGVFSEGLQEAFEQLGVASSLFSYKELGDGLVIGALLRTNPDCTAGFNVTVAKHSPLEPLGIPHLSMIVDSATYFPELLQNPNAIVSFVDEDSVGFFKMLGKKYVFHLPHAIDNNALTEQNANRDLDVVMCGSYIDSSEILATWKSLLSPKMVLRLVEVAETVLASTHISHLKALVGLIERRDDFEKELLEKSIDYFDLANSLDQYIRGVDRIGILEAIERPVHIFGAKKDEDLWSKSISNPKKLIFHGEVPYKEMSAILRRSRIVINSFPMFKRGLHERVLLSLASGASVVGSDNIYMQKCFGVTPALMPSTFPDYAKVNVLIDAALKDEDARFSAVVATHDTIRAEHTWDVRAKTLLEKIPSMLEEIHKTSQEGISHLFGKNSMASDI